MKGYPSLKLRRETDRGQLLLFDPLAAPTAPRPPGDLDELLAELSERFFGGRLKARVEWSSRLVASAGTCNRTDGIIRISRAYHEKRPDHLRATLAHEMCHLLVPDHGAEFRRLAEPIARALGVSWEDFRYAQRWADLQRYRYVYACPECGLEIPSRKRRRVSCVSCGGPEYSDLHRLTLSESRARPGPVLLGERPARLGSYSRDTPSE